MSFYRAGRLFNWHKKSAFFVALSVVIWMFSSCASEPTKALDDERIVAIIITRRDILNGDVSILVDGKNAGKLKPIGRIGIELKPGTHTISVEYKGQKTPQVDFTLSREARRIEYDVWVYQNGPEPIVLRKRTIS